MGGYIVMAVRISYYVSRQDGSGFKVFFAQKAAERYAKTLKRTPDEQIKIVKKGWGEEYVYYV
jgi:dsDNA-binding SOS-regulon protein